jgi:hypothetical protein
MDLDREDDYLTHIRGALAEATEHIGIASGVFVENADQRDRLGGALGQAGNAIARARRDLDAHEHREEGHRDRSDAARYIEKLDLTTDAFDEQLAIAVVPLPLVTDRIPLAQLEAPAMSAAFLDLVNRFNGMGKPVRFDANHYLTELPGSLGGSWAGDHFLFKSWSQGTDTHAGSLQQVAVLYETGAYVYADRQWPKASPNIAMGLEVIQARVVASLTFAQALYRELRLVPRAIGIQVAMANVGSMRLVVPTDFGGHANLFQRADLPNILRIPEAPIAIRFAEGEDMASTAWPPIERAIRSLYETRPNA